MNEHFINQVALFSSLPPHEVKYLSLNLSEREFSAGTVLMRENEPAEHFFMLLEGQVEIIKELGTASERLLNVGHAGSYFGEMGLINPGSLRTASVRARTPIRMLEMTRGDFDALLRRQPALAYKMVRALSLRLDDAEKRTIRDLQDKNVELGAACDRLRSAQEHLIARERLNLESELAGEIRQRMVPRMNPNIAGFDIGARTVQTDPLGGDFFDLIPLPGGRLGITIGEVADKGVPAALIMGLTINLVRAEARRGGAASETLRVVRAHLAEINATKTPMTILFGVLDGAVREFRYARAGHEPPLVFNAQGEWVNLPDSPGLPLDREGEIGLDEQRLSMAPGDTMVCYTKGALTAMNAGGAEFGVERLRGNVRIACLTPAQMLCDTLHDRIASFRSGTPQRDDITLVTVQVS